MRGSAVRVEPCRRHRRERPRAKPEVESLLGGSQSVCDVREEGVEAQAHQVPDGDAQHAALAPWLHVAERQPPSDRTRSVPVEWVVRSERHGDVLERVDPARPQDGASRTDLRGRRSHGTPAAGRRLPGPPAGSSRRSRNRMSCTAPSLEHRWFLHHHQLGAQDRQRSPEALGQRAPHGDGVISHRFTSPLRSCPIVASTRLRLLEAHRHGGESGLAAWPVQRDSECVMSPSAERIV